MSDKIRSIVPPEVLDKISKNAPERATREAARRSLITTQQMAAKRELAPVPQPHIGNEKREISDAKNTTSDGKTVRNEGDPDSADPTVNEAFFGLGNTYGLYLTAFGRDSLDNKALPLVGVVHYDKGFDNAFYDATDNKMRFGDGSFFNAFTRDLTVTAHELTHGVTEYTAKLNYQGQSGALNESMSDVFGVLAEQYAYGQDAAHAAWLVGAKLCEGKIQGRALRDMLNPGTAYDDPVIGKDPQGADMAHYDPTSQDNGGVHINSGIPNRAFALAAIERGGNAWETIGKVWYTALTTKVGPTTNFQQFADITLAVASDLYGSSSPEAAAILHGWATVGIKAVQPSPGPTPTPTPAPSPGQSPCTAHLNAILKDPAAMKHILALGKMKNVRVLLADLHLASKVLGDK